MSKEIQLAEMCVDFTCPYCEEGFSARFIGSLPHEVKQKCPYCNNKILVTTNFTVNFSVEKEIVEESNG